MAKYIKIFFFLLLLGLTSLTTACVEEIKESKNNGNIVIENNENYATISTYGVIDNNVEIIENCENNGDIKVNNNTNNSSSEIKVCGINDTCDEIKNSTNNKNIEINNNSDKYTISAYGIVSKANNIENCKNNGKITVNGIEQEEQ